MKKTTIAIIGSGTVGSTTAYSLMLNNLASEILMVDCNDDICKAQVDDLTDSLAFNNTQSVSVGTYKQAGQADIAIICAGAAQQPGQSRLELLKTNADIISSILNDMAPISKDLILIMVTNPVDILTQLAQNLSGLPQAQVFGSGTLLDTQRWRGYISKEIGVAEQSIHAYIIGNHGDAQVPIISSANIAGVPLIDYPNLGRDRLYELAKKAQLKVYNLLDGKGTTEFGIASCVAALCSSVIYNQKKIMPLVVYSEMYKTYLSLPATVGAKGIVTKIPIAMDAKEKEALDASAETIKKAYEMLK